MLNTLSVAPTQEPRAINSFAERVDPDAAKEKEDREDENHE